MPKSRLHLLKMISKMSISKSKIKSRKSMKACFGKYNLNFELKKKKKKKKKKKIKKLPKTTYSY